MGRLHGTDACHDGSLPLSNSPIVISTHHVTKVFVLAGDLKKGRELIEIKSIRETLLPCQGSLELSWRLKREHSPSLRVV